MYTIAKNVSGGLRDSLALLDQVSILGIKDTIDKDLIDELLGKINFDTLLNLLKKINSSNVEETIISINEIYKKGNEPRNLAENFIEFLRNVILVINSDNDAFLGFTNLITDNIEKIKSENFNKDTIFQILNIFIEYYKEIKVSTNPYLWVELAGITSCNREAKNINITSEKNAEVKIAQNFKPAISPVIKKEVKQEIKNEPKIEEIENPKAIEPESIKEIKEIEPEITNTNTKDISSIWSDIINSITSLPTKAFFSGVAKLVSIENSKITLGFLNENLIAQAKSSSKLPQLQSAVDKIVNGYSVDFIKITKDTKTLDVKIKKAPIKETSQIQYQTKPIQQPQVEIREEDNNEELEKDKKQYSPEVQEMLEQFSGRIIE